MAVSQFSAYGSIDKCRTGILHSGKNCSTNHQWHLQEEFCKLIQDGSSSQTRSYIKLIIYGGFMPLNISAYKLPARCLHTESTKRNREIAAYIIVDRLPPGIKEAPWRLLLSFFTVGPLGEVFKGILNPYFKGYPLFSVIPPHILTLTINLTP